MNNIINYSDLSAAEKLERDQRLFKSVKRRIRELTNWIEVRGGDADPHWSINYRLPLIGREYTRLAHIAKLVDVTDIQLNRFYRYSNKKVQAALQKHGLLQLVGNGYGRADTNLY